MGVRGCPKTPSFQLLVEMVELVHNCPNYPIFDAFWKILFVKNQKIS
jgi:hypothetical protein